MHRDIKPSNVMLLLSKKHWTIIDFGCAAETGTTAKLMFTLSYSAPETLRARRGGADCVLVTEALDAWSLGVLALEMFTKKTVFPKVLFNPGQVRLFPHPSVVL